MVNILNKILDAVKNLITPKVVEQQKELELKPIKFPKDTIELVVYMPAKRYEDANMRKTFRVKTTEVLKNYKNTEQKIIDDFLEHYGTKSGVYVNNVLNRRKNIVGKAYFHDWREKLRNKLNVNDSEAKALIKEQEQLAKSFITSKLKSFFGKLFTRG